jgi:hypothetical protein
MKETLGKKQSVRQRSVLILIVKVFAAGRLPRRGKLDSSLAR